MEKYNVEIWTLLKSTKTDKNKFVREASLACLKKFGPLLKESLPEKAKKKTGKSRGGKKKKNKAFFDKNKKINKKKSETKLKGQSSKEIQLKSSKSIKEGKNSKMRGKIINKKMNLKNVKGRLDLKKLKAQFQQKKNEESEEIEIKFKEPEKKIDYEKWMNEETPEAQTVHLKKKESKKKTLNKKKSKKGGSFGPDFEIVTNEKNQERSKERNQDPELEVIQNERIPEPFSDEEENPKMANPDRPILNGSQRNHDLDNFNPNMKQ